MPKLKTRFDSIYTSVARAVSTSVNSLLNRETQHVNSVENVVTLEGLQFNSSMISFHIWLFKKSIHTLQNLVFFTYLNFQRHNSFKIFYLPHSESKSYQINSIKSCSSRSFQQHQRHIPIPPKFSATI
jgi:hypothetical protein